MNSKKIALYARVSKAEDQEPENQLLALRAYAQRSGFEIEGEYVEKESSRNTRPIKEALLKKLFIKELDAVVFTSLDRWGRSSRELILEFEAAMERGHAFISLRENIDLTTASGKLYFTLLSAFAEFERAIISERTKAGLVRAKAQGKKLGIPRVPQKIKKENY